MHRLPRTLRRAPRRAVTRAATTAALAIASLALAGCGKDGGPDVGTPSRIELVGAAPTAAVNSMVTPPPSVKVSDAEGRAVPNVSVTFTAAGGGTMTDGVQRTDAQGVATVGSWRLGTAAGSGNTLVATAGTLTTTITATATPGVAANHEAAPGQPASQSAQPSTAVATPPAVRVTDAYGNPKPGVVVTFAPGANSGTVTDGLRTTNAQGIATVGSWTVGSATGQQTLVANVAGGMLPPVTFIANVGSGNPSACTFTPYTLGSTVNGSLAVTDCPFGDGTLVDLYRVTSTSMINHDFRLTSSDFDARLWVATTSIDLLGLADHPTDARFPERLRLIAPAGSYAILANSFEDGETGPYTLSSSTGPRPVGCDEESWLVPGVTFAESVSASDCRETNGAGTFGDVYLMVLKAGRTVTITMRSPAVDAYLRVLRGTETGTVVQGQDDNGGGGTDAQVTFTVPSGASESLFGILATTSAANSTGGAYTLEVTSPSALAAGAPVRAGAEQPIQIGPHAIEGAGSWWPAAPWGGSFRRARAAR